MKYVKRLTDYDEGNRHELWYSKFEYGLMKRANWVAVHAIRAKSSAGVPVSYGGNDGGNSRLHQRGEDLQRTLCPCSSS